MSRTKHIITFSRCSLEVLKCSFDRWVFLLTGFYDILQINKKTPVDYYNKYLCKQIEVQRETKY